MTHSRLLINVYPSLVGYGVSIVVKERVTEMLTAGFKAKSYEDIRDNLGEYFVVNYFGEADYLGNGSSGVPGHIPGAFQFTPYESLGIGEMLAYLPPDMPIVVYCWTGQHSSQVTAYLNMLGYDAYSLKLGGNNLFHTNLTAHKWTSPKACLVSTISSRLYSSRNASTGSTRMARRAGK